ncbi:MAG: hypothetical protein ACE5K7_01830 [Phycisphaerae bacterium]
MAASLAWGQVHGRILDQQLDQNHQGYTVLQVWGSHYQMGYAHGFLRADHIAAAVAELKAWLGPRYPQLRKMVATTIWKPPAIEQELDGMVAALARLHPRSGIDKLDLKLANTQGDWSYACRSHACWGRFVAEPIKTLISRRLDYSTPLRASYHHVLCAWIANDSSPAWVNWAWPGMVTVTTAVNEYGTLVALHDYHSRAGTVPPRAMPRMVAARYALTMPVRPDPAEQLRAVYAELRRYPAMTGGFLNYFAPQGYGGVMTSSRQRGFYHLRRPQPSYFRRQVLITTNAWTDGTYSPEGGKFMADYYAAGGKTLASHWALMGDTGMHKMSVAYRGRADMTIWVDGRLPAGRTPRLQWQWKDLTCIRPGPRSHPARTSQARPERSAVHAKAKPPEPPCPSPRPAGMIDRGRQGDPQ